MFGVQDKLRELVFKQDPVVPNSVSIKQLTDGDAYFEGKSHPVDLFDVLAICLVQILLKKPAMNTKPFRQLSKEDVNNANVWMAALGYQAEVGVVPEGAMCFPIDDDRGVWFRHQDNLGEDIVSWCSDRSLVKYLSADPTIDGPFAWYRTKAAQPDQQDIASRDLCQQLREAAQFFLRGVASPDWLFKSYSKIEPYLTSCLVRTQILTKQELEEQGAFLQKGPLKPVVLTMDAEEQHCLLVAVNDTAHEIEGPVDEYEDMISKLTHLFCLQK